MKFSQTHNAQIKEMTHSSRHAQSVYNDRLSYGRTLKSREERTIYSEESQFQHIEVTLSPYFGYILRLDGSAQLSTFDEFIYHEALVHSALMRINNPESILIIGGGDGGAAKQALYYPSIRSITVVEIDKKVTEISHEFFPKISHSLRNKNVRMVNKDGHEFIKKNTNSFDAIIIDVSDNFGPAKAIYTKSFFLMCRAALKPNGFVSIQSGVSWNELIIGNQIREILHFIFPRLRVFRIDVPLFAESLGAVLCSNSEPNPREGLLISSNINLLPEDALRFYSQEQDQAMFLTPKYSPLRSNLGKTIST